MLVYQEFKFPNIQLDMYYGTFVQEETYMDKILDNTNLLEPLLVDVHVWPGHREACGVVAALLGYA